MIDDGWKPLSPKDFAALVEAQTATHSILPPQAASPSPVFIETRLGGSLEENLRRQLAFLGNPPIVEIQSLGWRRKKDDTFERTRAAHATSIEMAVNLCEQADAANSHGVYILPAILHPGVETRNSAPGKWHEIPKGGGTTDSDIAARLTLAVDFDVKRPAGTSASDEELSRSIEIATKAYDYLSSAIGADAIAYLHSGNGRQLHIALDHLPNDEAMRKLCAGLLVGFDAMWSTNLVNVDRSLFDAKRILPACGTVKKKGATGIESRPHRRTAIVTPENVKRLSAEELRELGRKVFADISGDDGKLAMNKTIGGGKAPPTVAPQVTPLDPKDGPFARAKAVNPRDVADWLGLLDSEGQPSCPGCGSCDAGVVILENTTSGAKGLKCSHNRCQDKGKPPGFRTNVDLVMEVRGVDSFQATKLLSERFGFEGFTNKPASAKTASTTSFEWISTEEIFAPLPPTQWLVPALHIVRGRPTLLAGYGYSGKTLMAQSMALALAAGAAVWGQFAPNGSSVVRHLDYEQGRHATLKRYQRLAFGSGISRASVGGRLEVSVFPEVYLDTPDAQDIYAKAVEGVGLVILDALRGATPTIDENDSAIRRCLDNLTRVSEKTGTAFLILHHAGKSRDEEGSDPRKVPRGSSAIFDASGCVFAIDGENKRPKRVQQTKAPAEAEGSAIDNFFLAIEDVATESNPTAGLRVVYLSSANAMSTTGRIAKFNDLKRSIMALVASNPNLTSGNSVNERVTGKKESVLTAIRELMSEGFLVQLGGNGTPFETRNWPGSEPVPTGSQSPRELVPGSPPLKGEPDQGTDGTEDVGNRSSGPMTDTQWMMVWANSGVDPRAKATEEGWDDERIQSAIPSSGDQEEPASSPPAREGDPPALDPEVVQAEVEAAQAERDADAIQPLSPQDRKALMKGWTKKRRWLATSTLKKREPF